MQRPKVINREWLDEHGACREQAQLFERVWPDGVAVTREALEQFAKKGLPLEWLAEQVLPRSDYAALQSLCAPMVADYQAQHDTLYAASQSQRDTLLINAVCNLYGADASALPPPSCATEAGNE